MDEFDEAILDTLIDGKQHNFNQILEKANFTHNTLRLHLDKLVHQTIVTREKVTREGRGEKGGFCKKVRMGCEAWNCPQITKWV